MNECKHGLKSRLHLFHILTIFHISYTFIHLTHKQLSLCINLYVQKQYVFLLRNYNLYSINGTVTLFKNNVKDVS